MLKEVADENIYASRSITTAEKPSIVSIFDIQTNEN